MPYHNAINSVQQILTEKIETVKTRLDEHDTYNLIGTVFTIKLMCKKLKLDEPDFIQSIDVFSNNSIDDLWNMQHHEFGKLEGRFKKLDFEQKT